MLPCLYHGNVMFCCCFVSGTMLLWSSYLKCNVKELINSIQIQELQFEFMNVDFKYFKETAPIVIFNRVSFSVLITHKHINPASTTYGIFSEILDAGNNLCLKCHL